MNLCVHIESNSNLNYMYLKYDLKNSIKNIFKDTFSFLSHILKIYEKMKCLLGIIQTSICNFVKQNNKINI